MACATADLKKNLIVNCDVPLVKGIGETIFMGRIPDLDAVTYDTTQKKLITAFTLKTGKKLKRYIGQNFSNQATVGFAAGEYINTIPQGLRYILFSNSVDDEAELDAVAQLKDMFAVIQRPGNPASYKVYGWQTGLRMNNLSMDTNDDTLKGAFVVELSAPDEVKTPYTLKNVTSGNDTTLSFLEGLALALS